MRYRSIATSALLTLLLVSPALSQDFHLIASDKSGDEQQSVGDVKSLSYAIDAARDSLWFRIETYQAHGGDFGYGIALDTDLIPTNGKSWGGHNKTMKYDLAIYIDRDVMDTNIVYGGVFTSTGQTTAHFAARTVDPHTVEVNLALSQIAPTQRFNIVAGAGFFDVSSTGSIYDDVPDNSFATVNGLAEVSHGDVAIVAPMFPNPATDHVSIFSKDAEGISVIGAPGTSYPISTERRGDRTILDIAALPNGVYWISYRALGVLKREKLVIAR